MSLAFLYAGQGTQHPGMGADLYEAYPAFRAVVDGADAVAAGNDVVMPGGPPVIAQIQKGFKEGRLSRAQLETAVGNLLYFVMRSGSFAAYHASEEV